MIASTGAGSLPGMHNDPGDAVLSDAQNRLVARFEAGEPLALSRCISLVENQTEGYEALLHALHGRVGRARRIGVTGPPGAGKSTLTSALARLFRDAGETVGIIAVDPSSPFTGGALLGDRVRMDDLCTEPGIFIRSMASRGSHGGLSATTREAADLMDAFGFDRIVLETVGVGQSELEIASQADTTIVVLVPESGDGIQAMKAGLMEVADIFVVNKADRPGADRLRKEIRVVNGLRSRRWREAVPAHHGVDLSRTGERLARAPAEREIEPPDWEPPVLLTVASASEGISELAVSIDDHFAHLEGSGALRERRTAAELDHARVVLERLVTRRASEAWEAWIAGREARPATPGRSPYQTAREIAASLGPGPSAAS